MRPIYPLYEKTIARLVLILSVAVVVLIAVEYRTRKQSYRYEVSKFPIQSKYAQGKRVLGLDLGYRDPVPWTMIKQIKGCTRCDGVDRPIPAKKPAGVYRIFVSGGSTIQIGTPAIPVLLEEQLKGVTNKKIEVYNYGVLSQGSSEELARIVFEVLDFEPDMILMYSGGNDILDPYLLDPRPGYPANFLLFEHNPFMLSIDKYPFSAVVLYQSEWMRRHFPRYFLNKIFDVDAVRDQVGFLTEPWRAEIARIFVNNLVKAHHAARGSHVKFISFLQPLIYFKKEWATEEKHLSSTDPNDPISCAFHSLRTRELIRTEMDRVQKKDPIPFVDLSDIFADTKDYIYTDFIHIRQPYNPVVAKAMAQVVKNELGGRTFSSENSNLQ